MTGDKNWSPRPARGYVWEPFKPGHTLSVTHGTRSARLVAERAAQVAEELAERAPWLAEELDGVAVETWCRAQARYRMLDDYVAAKAADEGVEAVPRTLWQEVSRAEANVMKATEALGLDPTGRARLMKDLGWARQLSQGSVGALAERGAKLRALRSAEGQGR